ncbi:MAG: 50S ribosomal protein L11 methyltransferase, partial [Thermoplasmata archaeon]|nr:50S ribosomal protein L11 methyltransferase [Thermoplasmata archaeon]
QVSTPTEAALELLETAMAREDLVDRSVIDLGSGTGKLAIGAALLGAESVTAIEIDPAAVDVARRNAERAGVELRLVAADAGSVHDSADTVLMNPPFGAQRRGADRPFWEAAFRCARRRIYAFALADSRTFIARYSVDSGGAIEATRPVPWRLPPTFAFHTRRRVELAVDLWVLRPPVDERADVGAIRDAGGAARHRRGVRPGTGDLRGRRTSLRRPPRALPR